MKNLTAHDRANHDQVIGWKTGDMAAQLGMLLHQVAECVRVEKMDHNLLGGLE